MASAAREPFRDRCRHKSRRSIFLPSLLLNLVKIAIVRAANCRFLRRTKETSSLNHSKGPRVSSSRKKKSPAILNTSGTLDGRHRGSWGWGLWRPSDSTNPLGAIPFLIFPHVPSTTHGGGSGG